MDRLGSDSQDGMIADLTEFVDSRMDEFQSEYGPPAKAGNWRDRESLRGASKGMMKILWIR